MRRVKKPTPTGIRIRIKAKQSITNPDVAGNVPELLTPFTSVEYGMLPVAVTAPNMHRNNPGQPQSKTEAIVAMRPVFLLFMMFLSNEMISGEYTVHEEQMQGSFFYPYFLTAQFCTQFIFKALHNFCTDRGSFGIGHRFVRLIRETVCE